MHYTHKQLQAKSHGLTLGQSANSNRGPTVLLQLNPKFMLISIKLLLNKTKLEFRIPLFGESQMWVHVPTFLASSSWVENWEPYSNSL